VAAAVEQGDVAFERDHRTVVDVGAHHGQFALFAAERFPGASLHCVEALPDAQALLEKVIEPLPRKRIHRVAAAGEEGTRTFHVSRLDDSSSLLPIGRRYTSAWPGTEQADEIEVRTARLDDVLELDSLERPLLLKIDVQGAELEVLRGAERLLELADEVFLEASFMEFYSGQALAGEVIAHLHGRGFELSGVFGMKRDRAGRCLQADLLFGRAGATG
jgi:FkbM family methyltransferase